MKSRKFSDWLHRWVRFLIGGALNTAVTYLLYLLLNIKLEYQVAYALAYVTGIVFSYLFNSVVVFRASLSLRRFMMYPMVYLIQYFASATLLALLVELELLGESFAPVLAIGATIPLTYFVARRVLKNGKGE